MASDESQVRVRFRTSVAEYAVVDVPIAVPAELYDSDGVLRLPFAWFAALYRAAP